MTWQLNSRVICWACAKLEQVQLFAEEIVPDMAASGCAVWALHTPFWRTINRPRNGININFYPPLDAAVRYSDYPMLKRLSVMVSVPRPLAVDRDNQTFNGYVDQLHLKHFARKIRQPRTLAARQCDVPTMRPAFEAVDGKRHA